MMRYVLAYRADAVYAGQPRYSLRVRNNDFQTMYWRRVLISHLPIRKVFPQGKTQKTSKLFWHLEHGMKHQKYWICPHRDY